VKKDLPNRRKIGSSYALTKPTKPRVPVEGKMVWGREPGTDSESVEDHHMEADEFTQSGKLPATQTAVLEVSNEVLIQDLPKKMVKLKGKPFRSLLALWLLRQGLGVRKEYEFVDTVNRVMPMDDAVSITSAFDAGDDRWDWEDLGAESSSSTRPLYSVAAQGAGD
jgi:hypothetical protein